MNGDGRAGLFARPSGQFTILGRSNGRRSAALPAMRVQPRDGNIVGMDNKNRRYDGGRRQRCKRRRHIKSNMRQSLTDGAIGWVVAGGRFGRQRFLGRTVVQRDRWGNSGESGADVNVRLCEDGLRCECDKYEECHRQPGCNGYTTTDSAGLRQSRRARH